jgi:hypothetical protein
MTAKSEAPRLTPSFRGETGAVGGGIEPGIPTCSSHVGIPGSRARRARPRPQANQLVCWGMTVWGKDIVKHFFLSTVDNIPSRTIISQSRLTERGVRDAGDRGAGCGDAAASGAEERWRAMPTRVADCRTKALATTLTRRLKPCGPWATTNLPRRARYKAVKHRVRNAGHLPGYPHRVRNAGHLPGYPEVSVRIIIADYGMAYRPRVHRAPGVPRALLKGARRNAHTSDASGAARSRTRVFRTVAV